MTEIYETQSGRTDLPLVVMPSVLDAMIEPIKAQFPSTTLPACVCSRNSRPTR